MNSRAIILILSFFTIAACNVKRNMTDSISSPPKSAKALIYNEKNVFVLNNYSYYLSLRNENLEKAIEMSKKSNELSPDNASFQDTYAWILYQQKKYELSKKWLIKAYENGGELSPVITEHLGDAYFKLGDSSSALLYWQKAKNIGKGSKYLEQKIVEKTLYE